MRLKKMIISSNNHLLIILISLAMLNFSCTFQSPEDFIDSYNEINLKWNKSYPDDSMQDAITGLSWCYSILGAHNGNVSNFTYADEIISIRISQLGFKKNAIEKIETLHEKMKESDEYKMNNNIDLGRYITLLIGCSEHYFQIVGIPESFSEITQKYGIYQEQGYVSRSSVSKVHRTISFSNYKNFNQLFIANEIDSISKQIEDIETIEIMDNGQLKFGVFDKNGNRKASTNPVITNAGKPGKCMWCHESNILPLFKQQNNIPNFLPYLQLQDSLINYSKLLQKDRNLLNNGVDFNRRQEHTKMELLYISFMEPSLEKLAIEWEMSTTEIQEKLGDLKTHVYDEFPFLGDLYYRNEVEKFAPFKSLQVSSSAREYSEIEVNYIN